MTPHEDDGKAESSQRLTRISAQGSQWLPGPLQLWEVAEGLWRLVARCESPHLEMTLEGLP